MMKKAWPYSYLLIWFQFPLEHDSLHFLPLALEPKCLRYWYVCQEVKRIFEMLIKLVATKRGIRYFPRPAFSATGVFAIPRRSDPASALRLTRRMRTHLPHDVGSYVVLEQGHRAIMKSFLRKRSSFLKYTVSLLNICILFMCDNRGCLGATNLETFVVVKDEWVAQYQAVYQVEGYY